MDNIAFICVFQFIIFPRNTTWLTKVQVLYKMTHLEKVGISKEGLSAHEGETLNIAQ